jgi:hypothetical protein
VRHALGRTLIGAREHREKSGSVLLNSRAELRAHLSGVSSVWNVAVQQYTVNFRSGRGAPFVRVLDRERGAVIDNG